MRQSLLLAGCSLLLTSCVFGSSKNEDNVASDTGSDIDNAVDDTSSSDDGTTADVATDTGPADLGRPDVGGADMTVAEIGPDLPPLRDPSAVCTAGTSSELIAQRQFRLRVGSSDYWVTAGYTHPTLGAMILMHTWSQWDTGEYWVQIFDYGGVLANPDELDVPDVTGVAAVPYAGVPGAIMTRRGATSCVYAEYRGFSGSLPCVDAWGAEVANLGGATPVYVWLGENGTISSMPVNDVAPLGQQITVPWCARDPANPTDCLPLEYGKVDVRASGGPYVLLSDSLGRAYLWDAVQNIDGSGEAIDCTTPPSAPVPLLLQGNPVMFADADLVRANGEDILVHQTASAVRLHRLGMDLQPLASSEELPNTGLRPLFDATSDGVRIAAATGVGSDIRLFAFGTGGGTLDVIADDDPTQEAAALGVTVYQNRVGVVVGLLFTVPYVAVANGYDMWP